MVEPKFYVYGVSHKDLDKGVKEVVKRVRLYGQLPKYTRISYEFAPCPGDVCGGCGTCWAGEGHRAAHEARVAELLDRNKGFLT